LILKLDNGSTPSSASAVKHAVLHRLFVYMPFRKNTRMFGFHQFNSIDIGMPSIAWSAQIPATGIGILDARPKEEKFARVLLTPLFPLKSLGL
jgi:hypothetical protein